MKSLEYIIKRKINNRDLYKAVGFVSDKIQSLTLDDNKLIMIISDDADEEDILNRICELEKKYSKVKSDQIFESGEFSNEYFDNFPDCLIQFNDEMIGLKNEGLILFKVFEDIFEEFAMACGAEKRIYPVLLPNSAYSKTGYLKNSPQYATFCCNVLENMDVLESLNDKILKKENIRGILTDSKYALSPSACFHTYLEYQDCNLEDNKTVTFTQSVFRNEGRFNFEERGRFRDYHVREIVFIGSADYVNDCRNRVLNGAIELVNLIGLNHKVVTASDPFVIPKMQKYKNIQILEKTKYELRLNIDKDNDISVASFNIHGTAFTSPFNINVKSTDNPVTGCVGFGLERWVYAFLIQYGSDSNKWPEIIKQRYDVMKGE